MEKNFILIVDVRHLLETGHLRYELREIEYDDSQSFEAPDHEGALDYCEQILGIRTEAITW